MEAKADVKKLKQIYEDAVEYLENKVQLDDFQNQLDKNAEKYKKQLNEQKGLNKLVEESKKLDKIIDDFENLKSGSNNMRGLSLFGEDDYEDYDAEDEDFENDNFALFSEKQIEEYFETQKKSQLLLRKIHKLEESINKKYCEYRENQQGQNKTKIDELKQKVLASGYKIIDLKSITKQKEYRYDLSKIEDMILENEYQTTFKRDDLDNDYSGELCYWHNKFNNWFGELSSNLNVLKFTTKKLAKNQPSTFEYFVKKLGDYTGKKYKRVHIVTNQTGCWHDHYEPDDYVVYCATLLLPEHLAEAFAMSEKKQTEKSIKKFVEKYRDVILLASKDIVYYTEDYHPIWNGSKKENDAKWKKHINSTKFDDIYREEVRDKLAKDEEVTEAEVKEMEEKEAAEEVAEEVPTEEEIKNEEDIDKEGE